MWPGLWAKAHKGEFGRKGIAIFEHRERVFPVRPAMPAGMVTSLRSVATE
jgi:hypothetical protein